MTKYGKSACANCVFALNLIMKRWNKKVFCYVENEWVKQVTDCDDKPKDDSNITQNYVGNGWYEIDLNKIIEVKS